MLDNHNIHVNRTNVSNVTHVSEEQASGSITSSHGESKFITVTLDDKEHQALFDKVQPYVFTMRKEYGEPTRMGGIPYTPESNYRVRTAVKVLQVMLAGQGRLIIEYVELLETHLEDLRCF